MRRYISKKNEYKVQQGQSGEGGRAGNARLYCSLSQAPCPWGQGQGSSIFLFASAAYKCEDLADVMESPLNIQIINLINND